MNAERCRDCGEWPSEVQYSDRVVFGEPDHRSDCPVRVERNAALSWLDAHVVSVRAAQRAEERADAPPLVRAAAEGRAAEAADGERGAASLLVAPSYDLGGGWKIETTEAARERVAKIRAAGRPGGVRE